MLDGFLDSHGRWLPQEHRRRDRVHRVVHLQPEQHPVDGRGLRRRHGHVAGLRQGRQVRCRDAHHADRLEALGEVDVLRVLQLVLAETRRRSGNETKASRFAAQTAIEALRQGDTSRKFLKKYDKLWDDQFGADYRRLYRLRQTIFKIPEEKLNSMIRHVSQLDAQDLTVTQVFKTFLREYPLLVVDAVPLLLGK